MKNDFGWTVAKPRADGQLAIALPGRPGRMLGRAFFWQGGSLWIGVGRGRTDWHDHHAHQIAISLGAPFSFRADPDDEPIQYNGAFVPAHQKHLFEAEGPLAHIFIEPETVEGRALVDRFGTDGIAGIPETDCSIASGLLAAALHDAAETEQCAATAQQVVAGLAGAASPATAVDPRIVKALAYLRDNLRGSCALTEVASAVALSPSRFRHLFIKETGTSFRAYILWLRLNAALQVAMEKRSWTEAAHEAGFADSAHLTRTFKRMFGINPAVFVLTD